ncbi:MAG: hypothetical protein KatS3mg111_1034 [Pirellulaceae bacterium]|nr:MAG: hypothetical protein KatS3mg111_1034 [Pirellulaceae bacterium]
MDERRQTGRFAPSIYPHAVVGLLVLMLSTVAIASARYFRTTPGAQYVPPAVAGHGGDNNEAIEGGQQDGAPTLSDLVAFAQEVLANLQTNVRDYRGILLRRERIAGVLGDEVRMRFKIRHEYRDSQGNLHPFAVYLKFEAPPSAAGREVIWVRGENDNKLVAHEGGLKGRLLGRMWLDPTGPVAMFGNKYPITEIGLLRMVETLLERAEQLDYLRNADIRQYDAVPVGEVPCRLYEIRVPEKGPNRLFHLAQIYVDTERMIPLKYAAYGWPTTADSPPLLEEEYTYLEVELNVGLTDMDFDPNNPGYEFP